MCWDACNLEHDEMDYATGANQKGMALMVKTFRTANRGADSCPGSVMQATCTPGDRCTPQGLTLYRGMCTPVAGSQTWLPMPPYKPGNQCLDMCDTKIPLDAFHDAPGKQAGTVSLVEQIRGGRDPAGYTTCPGASVWVWLWFPILLCCLLGFCYLAYWMFNYYRTRLRKDKNRSMRDNEPFVQDEVPYGNYDQVQPQMGGGGDPMPVMEQEKMPVMDVDQIPQMQPVVQQQPMTVAAPAAGQSLFGTPDLMGGLAPATVMPPTTTTYTQASPYSMQVPMATQMTQMPAATYSQYGAAPYGAYSSYGGSYRIG